MTVPTSDSRAVNPYRIPATSLRTGDLINTSPGAEEDWQQVLSVHTAEAPAADQDSDAAVLVREIGDRYVVVRMTDIGPVDSPVYFAGGQAMAYGLDGAEDGPVGEVLTPSDASRTFLFTRYELVTVRS